MRSLRINILLLVIFCTNVATAQLKKQLINSYWKVRNTKETSWMDAVVPGCIHHDLFLNKKISAPYFGNNEQELQWIETEDWEYACYFDVRNDVMAKSNMKLVFEGLDTYCKIILNGKTILETNDMFATWSVDVSNIVQKQSNYLIVQFANTLAKDKENESKSSTKIIAEHKNYGRKAAFQYGTDMSPRLIGCGIWKNVYLQSGIDNEKKINVIPFATFDSTRFAFLQNNKAIFIKGANIVPPNSILSFTQKTDYDNIIQNCLDAHINMVRVWGGGIYLDDYFYEQCDKNNIMVWQDFMFANALPALEKEDEFAIKKEVADQINRLSKHPCIVLWCGNSELDEMINAEDWKKKLNAFEIKNRIEKYKNIFDVELRKIVNENDPAKRAYISTSGKTTWTKNNITPKGDVHYWGVGIGKEPTEEYYTKVPKFMSAYGMQALPDIHSILAFCDVKDIKLDKTEFTNHQKNAVGFEDISYYLSHFYPVHKDSLAYIYYTQLLQRDAISKAISAQRTAFPYCNGSMVWQLNDCWPAISCSLVDYFNRPKASFYALKKLYDNNFLTVSKMITDNDKNIIDTSKYAYALSLSDASFNVADCKTTYTVYDFYGNVVYKSDKISWQKSSNNIFYAKDFFHKKAFDNFHWALNYLVVEISNNNNIDIKKIFYFDDDKNLKLQPTTYTVKWNSEKECSITSTGLAKDIYLYSSNSKTTFSDNYFDLLPNETKTIKLTDFVKGTDKLEVKSSIDMLVE